MAHYARNFEWPETVTVVCPTCGARNPPGGDCPTCWDRELWARIAAMTLRERQARAEAQDHPKIDEPAREGPSLRVACFIVAWAVCWLGVGAAGGYWALHPSAEQPGALASILSGVMQP